MLTEVPNIKAKSIFGGNEHTAIIDFENNVRTSGRNNYGQLGLNDTTDRSHFTEIPNVKAKTLSCGGHHTIIIDMDDNVWGFGLNSYGQLGLGNQQSETIKFPRQIPNIKAKAVACGENHTIIIDMDNNVWSFGRNNEGQLGLGDGINRNIPIQISNIKAQAISCGESHTIIIDMDDNLLACGHNKYDQLGVSHYEFLNSLVPIKIQNIKAKAASCGARHTVIINLIDSIESFGDNTSGQSGVVGAMRDIKASAISCGAFYTLIILKPPMKNFTHSIKFNELVKRLELGLIERFEFLPQYQLSRRDPRNFIATVFGTDGTVYLVELQYDQSTNQIFPPL